MSEFKKPIIKNETGAFHRYINHVFNPAVVKQSKALVYEDTFCGCLIWQVKGIYEGNHFSCIYATPLWDGNLHSIPIDIQNDDGETILSDKINYPFDNWTMDVNEDVHNYLNTVKNFLYNKFNSVIHTPL